ncbi:MULTISPECIES: hypothetical protein [Halobacterium]|uniref:NUDIX family hydrolase n=3 Tax=Halobacterium salinarum TaxID=2242 RepID=Q9HRY7_HALSA|nr:hypothetical protein [Halobacterium salinarum]AAG19021.1 hypothetical protein VNG_0485H [Halobacterium salinarum NRC-1]MDL0125176.1 hypothetical protein [Halobacterium salinarum]MDL0129651.1 hypothetical protein [Halobacterium salinarum]MDL0136720.1 hypothetical protein [Halobacterium salinarum]MDL0142470.1 hypothetical protein [Halobacterium salinarum]
MRVVTDTRAACLVRRDAELLVVETVGSSGGRVYRPPGRAVGADDTPEDAVTATFEDMLGVALEWVAPIGSFDGTVVFEADLGAVWPYTEEGFTVYDPDTGDTTRLAWLHRDDFRKYGETIEPEGLLAEL